MSIQGEGAGIPPSRKEARRSFVRKMSRGVVWVVAPFALLGISGGQPFPGPDPQWFAHQRPLWTSCGIDDMDSAGAQCAQVLVPLDYAHPTEGTLSVAVSRVPATDSANRLGVLFANPGGPGASGLDTMDLLGDVLSPQVRAHYDLIGFDPRGVGRSGRADRCGWPIGEMVRSAGMNLVGFLHDSGQSGRMAVGCLHDGVARTRQFTTRNTARDMDVVRMVLGERRISYYGVSYGTYLGEVYAQMFPTHSDRMVLDSAIDPDRYWEGMVQDWGSADEAALDDWARWAAPRDSTYHLGRAPTEVRATLQRLIAGAARQPVVVDGFPIDDHWLPFILHDLLHNFRLNESLAGIVREIADDSGGPAATARSPKLRAIVQAIRDGENSALAIIACNDTAAPKDLAWYWTALEATRAAQPVFGALANNVQPCAYWLPPVEPTTLVRNRVPALILQATGDPRTPYEYAVRLHRDMSASRLVTLQDVRIHMTFRPGLSACVNDAINTYFGNGMLPDEDLVCHADPGAQ
jgi:pimeloyl-ACP methyl ester carboxylesterase